MVDTSGGLPVTGHGGEFSVSSPAMLWIEGGRARLMGRDGQSASLDLLHARAGVLGTCISIQDRHSDIAFSIRNPEVFAEVRANSPADLVDQLDRAAAKLRKRQWTFPKVMAASIISVTILGVALYYGIIAAAGWMVHSLPVSFDQELGKAAHRSMLEGEQLNTNATVHSAMDQILESLIPHLSLDGIEPEMVIVESETVNAYCLPGGYITVFTGLLTAAESADEVAGVLAHEMAHATKRHGLRQLVQSLSLAVAIQAMLGDVTGMAALGGGLEILIGQGYSRDLEAEADTEGLQMMQAAGWNPDGLATFFERLEVSGEGVSVPVWFSSHPDPGGRAESIREQMKTVLPGDLLPPEIDWDLVRSALEQ